ncbi:ATP-binding protein [Dankookia sp. P2]|uniref:ATP-binding protein n=1 Tax=Dankookia sp. P2 TaxID=3423955 RepID=UPI003D678C61
MFGDTVVATALLDRLLHHAIVVRIEGASYRLRRHADLLPDTGSARPMALGRAGTHGGAAGHPSSEPATSPPRRSHQPNSRNFQPALLRKSASALTS